MRVLVTGGAGFIGSHTADALLQKGHEVRVLDNLEPPVHPRREKPAYLSPEIDFQQGDVRSRTDTEKALHGVDAVFHLAAYQGYLTDFSKFAAVNDTGTALLYEIIVSARLPVQKVVVASSQAVYGEGKHVCQAHGVQYPLPRLKSQLEKGDWELLCPTCGAPLFPVPTDETRVNPHNQYAASKYSQELFSLALGRRYGIPSVALRYSITQGPRQSFSNAYSGVMRIFTVRLLTGQPLPMYEDGQQLRDYVHISDVVAANMLVLENPAADYQAYNVGGGKAYTVREFADLLIRASGKKAEPICTGEFRYGDVRHIISDIGRLRRLGWEPRQTIDGNIHDYLEWARAQPGITDHYADAEWVMRRQGVIQTARPGK